MKGEGNAGHCDICFLGSSTLFSALLTKCVEKEVIAVCRFTARKNVSPYFVALVPQEEELDDQNFQVTPAGMWQRSRGPLGFLKHSGLPASVRPGKCVVLRFCR